MRGLATTVPRCVSTLRYARNAAFLAEIFGETRRAAAAQKSNPAVALNSCWLAVRNRAHSQLHEKYSGPIPTVTPGLLSRWAPALIDSGKLQ